MRDLKWAIPVVTRKALRWLGLPVLFLLSQWSAGWTQPEQGYATSTYQRDTSRIHQLCALGKQYQYSRPDQAEKYLDSAYQEARQLGYKKGEAQAGLQLGVIAIIQSDVEAGRQFTLQALRLFQVLNDTFSIGDCHKNLGIANYYQGNYAEAKACYDKAIALFRQAGAVLSMAKCYTNMGNIYQQWGEYQEALGYYLKSAQLVEQLGLEEGLGQSYGNIAMAYRSVGDLEAASAYHQKALLLFEKSEDQYNLSVTLNNIGLIYEEKQAYTEALSYFQQAFDKAQSLGGWHIAVHSLNNIGYAYFKQGDYSRALPYYERALAIGKELKDPEVIANVLENIATIHIKNKSYTQALTLLQEALTQAAQARQKNDLKSLHDTFSQVYTEMGHYQQALQHYQIARAYQDSLFNEEKSRQIAQMRTRYEVEKKEHQITAQQQEINLMAQTKQVEKQLRLVLIITLGLLFLLLMFMYSRYRLKRQSVRMLHLKNEEIQAKNLRISQMNQELEKRMLRAQMDPHFIFNSLNSIQHFITTNDKTSALKYLSKFSRLVRQVLENSVNTQVPLADEIKLLEHYMALEELRYNHSFGYVIQVDESVDVYDTEIPFLLIQPYVENALVHGLRHKAEAGQLRIEIKQEDHSLLCRVEDNGVGRIKARQYRGQSAFPSRGMSVTQQRLDTLNHDKTEKTQVHTYDLVDEQGNACGTRVDIVIPQTETPCLQP